MFQETNYNNNFQKLLFEMSVLGCMENIFDILLNYPLKHRLVVLVMVQSMGQIDLLRIFLLYFIRLCAK